MMGDDNWAEKALTDDSIVVSLLVQIKHHHQQQSYPAPFRWGHRQLRSKPPSSKHQRHTSTTRCSPTTPLSWSDGCDTSAARSKGTCAYETGTAACKKSRKKKTFTELREEESYLMNERVHLEKLASVHVALNEQRYRGDNLKRIKLDFHGPSTNEMLAKRDGPLPTMFFHCRQSEAILNNQNNLIFPRRAINNDPESSRSCKPSRDNKSRDRCFILPDLNMTPAEDPGCESSFREA